MDKKIILGIILVIIVFIGVYAATNEININSDDIINNNIDVSNLEVSDNVIFDDANSIEKKLFNTNQSDVNTLLINNNASVDIKNSVINKSGDSLTNGDSSDFYGTNSAVLVQKGSVANIENVNVISNSTGSNAIFVTNSESDDQTDNNADPSMQGQPGEMPGNSPGTPPDEISNKPDPLSDGKDDNGKEFGMNSIEDYSNGGATANVKNVEINTYQDKSRGLDATYGGIINAENVVINTRDGSCAALATDRGEGTVEAVNCELNTGVDNGTGRGSPCIYSTGNITVKNSKGTAFNSQIACIEGKNSITLIDCILTAFGTGNREENGNFVDLGGFFIYQSMSGDADVGTATLNATDSKFIIDESSEYYSVVPMFHVTNTKAIINLENCEFKFGSGTLLNISGQNQWGTTGNNGGDLEFNLNKETIEGNIFVDEISSLTLNLKDSKFNGAINNNKINGNIDISLDENSIWTLTGDSYVTNLDNQGTINYGSYTLYVNGEAYTTSNPYN